MEYPRFVFTSPGPLSCGHGKTYGEHLVSSDDELAAALAEGFFASLPEALDPPAAPAKAPSEPEPAPEPAAVELAPAEPEAVPRRRGPGRPRAEEA